MIKKAIDAIKSSYQSVNKHIQHQLKQALMDATKTFGNKEFAQKCLEQDPRIQMLIYFQSGQLGSTPIELRAAIDRLYGHNPTCIMSFILKLSYIPPDHIY